MTSFTAIVCMGLLAMAVAFPIGLKAPSAAVLDIQKTNPTKLCSGKEIDAFMPVFNRFLGADGVDAWFGSALDQCEDVDCLCPPEVRSSIEGSIQELRNGGKLSGPCLADATISMFKLGTESCPLLTDPPTLTPTEIPTAEPTLTPTADPTEVARTDTPTEEPTAEPTLTPTEFPTEVPVTPGPRAMTTSATKTPTTELTEAAPPAGCRAGQVASGYLDVHFGGDVANFGASQQAALTAALSLALGKEASHLIVSRVSTSSTVELKIGVTGEDSIKVGHDLEAKFEAKTFNPLPDFPLQSLRMEEIYCTDAPTAAPTDVPTPAPTAIPTEPPSLAPTDTPTFVPTVKTPPRTHAPTVELTMEPTAIPTEIPTEHPTQEPTQDPTRTPTEEPSAEPTHTPTEEPTATPTEPPTFEPSFEPTAEPSEFPTAHPTEFPTEVPTATPTVEPTREPTREPTETPTENPTEEPTHTPTHVPTTLPPTTDEPSFAPTDSPTENPTEFPTHTPTEIPTPSPSEHPTEHPTEYPTHAPTELPTAHPTAVPTEEPTLLPTEEPTASPTHSPTRDPTHDPTEVPTETPTEEPTAHPTFTPSAHPTFTPTEEPTPTPTEDPTQEPTTKEPTAHPTADPTADPTHVPTPTPTEVPTHGPTELPTFEPSPAPTELPTTRAPTGCIAGGAKMHILFKAEAPSRAPARRLLSASPASLFDAESPNQGSGSADNKKSDDKCILRSHDCPSQRNECAEAPPGCHYSKELEKLGNGMCCPRVCHLVCFNTSTSDPTAVPSQTPTEVPTTLPPTTDEPSFAPSHTPTEPPTALPSHTPTYEYQVSQNAAVISTATTGVVTSEQLAHSETIATAVAGKLNLPAAELAVMTYKEDGVDGVYHTELEFKGGDAVNRGYALEQDVVQNKFNPIPGYPIDRLYMEELFDCGVHAVGSEVTRTDFNMPNTGFRGLTKAPTRA